MKTERLSAVKKMTFRFIHAIMAIFFASHSYAEESRAAKKIAEEQGYGYQIDNLYELNELVKNSELQLQLFVPGCRGCVPSFYDISFSQIISLFKMGASPINTKNITTVTCERDMRVAWTLNDASDVEHLDIFLQSIHELTSTLAKDPNNKTSLENMTRFISLFYESNKQKLLKALDEL